MILLFICVDVIVNILPSRPAKIYYDLSHHNKRTLGKGKTWWRYGHPSIAEVGFVYCTTGSDGVNNEQKIYGVKGLLLLELDTEEIVAKIVYEDLKGMGENIRIYMADTIQGYCSSIKTYSNKQGEFVSPKKSSPVRQIYIIKTIIYPFQSHKFEFEVAETFFHFDIDHGTDI